MDSLGLLDCLFCLVIAVMWWRFYNAAHPPPNDKKQATRYAGMAGLVFAGLPPTEAAAPKPPTLEQALVHIQQTGGYQDPAAFLAEARRAYERIVKAFALGELDEVEPLLSDGVRDDFRKFIAARRQRNESETLTFVGFRGADIVEAGYDLTRAWIDVRFATSMVSVTRDGRNRIVAGHPARLNDCAEIWTFERQTTQKGAPWRLTATDSDE
jgi:predicted lipid-binding transport protein (Tim44 family)